MLFLSLLHIFLTRFSMFISVLFLTGLYAVIVICNFNCSKKDPYSFYRV